VRGASDVVLTALMDALRLSAIERDYFLDLVRQVNASGRPPRHGARADMPPRLQQMADAMAEVTVLVRNRWMDVIGGNARAKALYAPVYAEPSPNLSRHVFLDPAARTFSPDWERMADINVGTLRLALARYPDDADLIALVDELAAANADFRERWPQHPVMQFGSGTMVFDHLTVGRMALQHEQLRLLADVTLVVNVYSAAPGSIDAQRFAALG